MCLQSKWVRLLETPKVLLTWGQTHLMFIIDRPHHFQVASLQPDTLVVVVLFCFNVCCFEMGSHYIAMAGLELTEIHVPLCLLGFRIEGHLYTCYFGYFVCFWDRVSDTFFFPFKFGFTHYILHMYCVLGYVLGLKAKGARHCLPPPAALIAAIAL